MTLMLSFFCNQIRIVRYINNRDIYIYIYINQSINQCFEIIYETWTGAWLIRLWLIDSDWQNVVIEWMSYTHASILYHTRVAMSTIEIICFQQIQLYYSVQSVTDTAGTRMAVLHILLLAVLLSYINQSS